MIVTEIKSDVVFPDMENVKLLLKSLHVNFHTIWTGVETEGLPKWSGKTQSDI